MNRIIYTAEEAVRKSDQRLLFLTKERISDAVVRATDQGKYSCSVRNVSRLFKEEIEQFINNSNSAMYTYHFGWYPGGTGLKLWWD